MSFVYTISNLLNKIFFYNQESFLYAPEIYYTYITLFWIVFGSTLFFVFKKFRLEAKKKDVIIIIFLVILVFFFGTVHYRHYSFNESTPYNTMSVCMSNVQKISLKEKVCGNEDFGGMAEVAWPALVSYAHALFGISFWNNFILALTISSLTSIVLYITFKQFFSRITSLLIVLLLFSIPINTKFLFSTTKEPLYNLFLAIIFLILAKFYIFKSKKDFLMLGILFAFFPEERIQFVLLFPIIIFLILLRKDALKKKLKLTLFYLIPILITFPYKLRITNLNLGAWFDTPFDFLQQKLTYKYAMYLLNSVFNDLAFIMVLSIIFSAICLIFFREKIFFSQIKYLFYFVILYNLIIIALYIYSDGVMAFGPHYLANITFTFWLQFLFGLFLILKFFKKTNIFVWFVLILAIYNAQDIKDTFPGEFDETFFKKGGDDIIGLNARFNEYSNLLEEHVDINDSVCYVRESSAHHNQEYIYIKDFQKYPIKGIYDHVSHVTFNGYETFCNLRNCKDVVFLGEGKFVNKIMDTIECYGENVDDDCIGILYKNRQILHTDMVYELIVKELEIMSECPYKIKYFNSDIDDLVLIKFHKENGNS